jgi:acyl carrier protein
VDIQRGELAGRIQRIISEKIINSGLPADVDDKVVAGLDSIGRLTLLVELENSLDMELMGPDIGPEVFVSLHSLTEYIAEKQGDAPSS